MMLMGRESIDQYSITSPYRLLISQFIIAMCSMNDRNVVRQRVGDAIMELTEIAVFNPTQPVRDQSR